MVDSFLCSIFLFFFFNILIYWFMDHYLYWNNEILLLYVSLVGFEITTCDGRLLFVIHWSSELDSAFIDLWSPLPFNGRLGLCMQSFCFLYCVFGCGLNCAFLELLLLMGDCFYVIIFFGLKMVKLWSWGDLLWPVNVENVL